MSTGKPAVFLDRDGTINEQMGYINHEDRFILLPGTGRAIKKLNDVDLPVVVVSNQSGVARGYFPRELVETVNRKMVEQLAMDGAVLDGLYYCPHHPKAEVEAYRVDCQCRKPKPGLLIQAAVELNLDLTRSFVVGDRLSDLDTGWSVGARGILVMTGYGRGEREYLLPGKSRQPDYLADDLGEAVDWIIRQVRVL